MMKLSFLHKAKILLVICLLGIIPSQAHAQVTISTNQALSFGTFAMGTFSSVITIEIRNNGSFTTSGSVSILVNPTRGEYTLDAGVAEAGTIYTVTTPSSITLTGPGSSFTVDNFSIRPNLLRFAADGTDDITVVGILNSLGDGVAFNGGTYTANLDLTVSF